MTADEIEQMRIAVEHDIDVIVRACAPHTWKGGDFKEGKETLDCIHPVESLVILKWDGGRPIAGCDKCHNELDNELVNIRLKQAGKYLA